MNRALAAGVVAFLAHAAVAQEPGQDLQAELATLVDLESPAERTKAAVTLSKGSEVKLEAWLAAMQAFAPTPDGSIKKGVSSLNVPLFVEGTTESTELHLYIPSSYDAAEAAPLMMMFHGTGGDGAGLVNYWRDLADESGMIVLAPSEAGANEGYAWEPRERASALAALRFARRRFNIDENRIFASGVSRGGHLTWDLALRHPDVFAAIAPMIGGPRFDLRQGANNIRYLENVVDLSIRDLQGARDDAGLVFNLRYAFERLASWQARDAKLVEFPELGHSYRFEAVDWADFLGRAERGPLAERVIRCSARPDEGRAFWLEVLQTDKRHVKEVFTPTISKQQNGKLDEEGMRRFLLGAADERTARIELRRTGVGSFSGDGKYVTRFRLLLTTDMFDPAEQVEVLYNGKKTRKRLKPSKSLLLQEFAERFDRSFLPVAEIAVRAR